MANSTMQNDTFDENFASIFNDDNNNSFSWLVDDLSTCSSDTPELNCAPDVAKSTPATGSNEAKVASDGTAPNQVASENKEGKVGYYHYKDFSTMEDPDPHVPVTKNGRIPSFPAKMYAILSRSDLQDIVSWMPHGRSWKVHKPREFEIKVIPAYFEHSKFSSFIRQANGWGFRRMMSKGPDRNSYYHELFLRGKPFLLKMMKRPTTNKKPLGDSNTEPDFYKIAQDRPLPEEKSDGEWDGLIRKSTYLQQTQAAQAATFAPNEMSKHPLYQVPSPVALPSTAQFQVDSLEPNPVYPHCASPVAYLQPNSPMPSVQHSSPVVSMNVASPNCNSQSQSSYHCGKPTVVMPSQIGSMPQLQQSMPTQTVPLAHFNHTAQPAAVLSESDQLDPLLCLREQQGGFEEPFSEFTASQFWA